MFYSSVVNKLLADFFSSVEIFQKVTIILYIVSEFLYYSCSGVVFKIREDTILAPFFFRNLPTWVPTVAQIIRLIRTLKVQCT